MQLDLNLNFVASYPGVGSPFDVVQLTLGEVNGLLVSDVTDNILHFFDPANPAAIVPFIDSDGVTSFNFPAQITFDPGDGNVRVTSLGGPDGFWEFDRMTGVQIEHVDTRVLFGHNLLASAKELPNGNVLYSGFSGLFLYDRVAGTSTAMTSGVAINYINTMAAGGGGVPFCNPANNNSTGGPASISGSIAGGRLHLEACGGPAGEFGYFMIGTDSETVSPIVLSNGLFCLSLMGGNSVGRYNVTGTVFSSLGAFDASGVHQNVVGTSSVGSGFDVPTLVPISGSPTIMAGETWHFQMWYRDSAAGVGTANFTDGLSVTF